MTITLTKKEIEEIIKEHLQGKMNVSRIIEMDDEKIILETDLKPTKISTFLTRSFAAEKATEPSYH